MANNSPDLGDNVVVSELYTYTLSQYMLLGASLLEINCVERFISG